MSGLAPSDAGLIVCQTTRSDVFDLNMLDVTPPHLLSIAIEHCQVAFLAIHLEFGTDRPYVLGLQRRLGANRFAFVPRTLDVAG
jgi:hypothetical protein